MLKSERAFAGLSGEATIAAGASCPCGSAARLCELASGQSSADYTRIHASALYRGSCCSGGERTTPSGTSRRPASSFICVLRFYASAGGLRLLQ